MGPIPGADIPGNAAFTGVAQDYHGDWKALRDKRDAGTITPEESAQFQNLGTQLDSMLEDAWRAEEPSPLGYQPLYSRLDKAIRASSMQQGTAEEWAAELRRAAPEGVSDIELNTVLKQMFDHPADSSRTAAGVSALADEKFGTFLRQAEQTRAKQIANLEKNTKIPEDVKAKKIAELNAPLDEDAIREKTYAAARAETAPRLTRADIDEMYEQNKFAVDVETQTDDDVVRGLLETPEQQKRMAGLQKHSDDLDLRASEARSGAGAAEARVGEELYRSIMSGHDIPDPALARQVQYTANSVGYDIVSAMRQGARTLDEVKANVQLPAKVNEDVMEAARYYIQQVDGAEVARKASEEAHEQLNRVRVSNGQTYAQYYTPDAGGDIDDRTISIYRGNDSVKKHIGPETLQGGTHFSGVGSPEIGHVRATGLRGANGRRKFLQEIQSDHGQRLQEQKQVLKRAKRLTEEGNGNFPDGTEAMAEIENTPFIGNKSGTNMMFRDQMHRAAVENKEGLLLQPHESVANVSGGSDAPAAFYRDVAPKMMEKNGAELGLEKTSPVEVRGSGAKGIDEYELDEIARENINNQDLTQIDIGIRTNLEEAARGEYANIDDFIQQNLSAEDLTDELPARFLGEEEMEALHEVLGEWIDNGGDNLNNVLREFAAEVGVNPARLYDEVEQRAHGHLDDYVSSAVDGGFNDAWDEWMEGAVEEEMDYLRESGGGLNAADAPAMDIPLDARLKLQKEGTYMLSAAPWLAGAGAAGLLARPGKDEDKKRGSSLFEMY